MTKRKHTLQIFAVAMGHWLPLQQFVQIRTARGVANHHVSCATVQVEETDVATQDGSDKSVQASWKSTFSTCVRTLVLGRLTLAWREHRGPTHGNPAEISGPFKHPRVVRWVLVGRGVNVPMIPSDQVTRCGTDQLLMWMQKSKLAHNIPCLIISWLKRLKLFFALLLCWRGGILLHFFSCLLLVSFVVLFCWGGGFKDRGPVH